MKNHLRPIFGVVCLCLLTQIGLAEEAPQLGEKGAKSKSKIKVCIPSQPPCPPIPGPEGPEGPEGPQGATASCPCPCGPTGPTGATGATGPTGAPGTCSLTYATVFVDGATSSYLPQADSPPDNASTIPFNTKGPSSSNITLKSTHRLTIPVGIYKVWFQTMLRSVDGDELDINSIFLRVYGTGAAEEDLAIDWTHSQADFPPYHAAYNGEAILQIADPGGSYSEVDVELIFEKTGDNVSGTFTLYDPESDTNSPAKMVLIKLDNLPPQV